MGHRRNTILCAFFFCCHAAVAASPAGATLTCKGPILKPRYLTCMLFIATSEYTAFARMDQLGNGHEPVCFYFAYCCGCQCACHYHHRTVAVNIGPGLDKKQPANGYGEKATMANYKKTATSAHSCGATSKPLCPGTDCHPAISHEGRNGGQRRTNEPM